MGGSLGSAPRAALVRRVLRMTLLGGVSAIAVQGVFLAPIPAFAACPPDISDTEAGPIYTTAGCDFSVTSSGVITGGLTGVINEVAIGALTNGGSISGANTGIYNNGGDIATLTNTGEISGLYSGILNNGSIGLVVNDGSLIANFSGLENEDGGTIGTLKNDVFMSASDTALYNFGTIGALINTGTIVGATSTGINNNGTITLVETSGTILGEDIGVEDFGEMGSLGNTGLISGTSDDGVVVGGFLGTLTNETGKGAAATISGGIDSGIGVDNVFFGTIGVLDNGLAGPVTGDLITGGGTGVFNESLLGVLSNNGTISGGAYGVLNTYFDNIESRPAVVRGGSSGSFYQGTITALTNSGSIVGGAYGVFNDSGAIPRLGNTGTITGGAVGVENSSFINNNLVRSAVRDAGTGFAAPPPASLGTLTNSGVIDGGATGVFNSALLSTLSNSGTISGGTDGVNNPGDMARLVNLPGGTITGGDFGLLFGAAPQEPHGAKPQLALVTAVLNEGLIEGKSFAGVGILSPISLVNAGTIIGIDGNAIDMSGGESFITLTTGSVLQGAIDGGGTDSQITLEGTDAMSNDIESLSSGALDILSGANWTASGVWDVGLVTNDGDFQGGLVGAPLDLTGDFVQNPDGTLVVAVAPAEGSFVTSLFSITGTAVLHGAARFDFAPGTYEAGEHAFLTANGGATGTFTSATYLAAPKGLTASIAYPDETDPDLVLTGPTSSTSGSPSGSIASGGTINPGGPTSPGGPSPSGPGKTPTTGVASSTPRGVAGKFVVAPLDSGIYADQIQASAEQGQAGNEILLDKASLGEAAGGQSAVCAAEASVTPAQTTPGQVSDTEKLTNAVASAICSAGGWIQASGTAMNVDPGYNADTAGFLAGIDAPVNRFGTRIGLAIGYDETWLADSFGGRSQTDTTRFGVFGSQPVGRFMVAGDFMYGYETIKTQRDSGPGGTNANHSGSVFSGALQGETLVRLGALYLAPAVGVRVASAENDGFAETGSGLLSAFAVRGAGTYFTSLQPFANVDVSHGFVEESGLVVTPDASVGYVYEANNAGAPLVVTSADGTRFDTSYTKLDRSAAELTAGVSAGTGRWALYARYSADVSGNWTSQTGEAGLRILF